jgi:beta-N-acetylhexosaminidase
VFGRRQFMRNACSALALLGAQPLLADEHAEIGRVIISGFRGTSTADTEVQAMLRYLENDQIAGVILLERNVVSPEQVLKLSLACRDASSGQVPIIAIDQEGGQVARLHGSNGFSDWMSAAEMAFADMTDSEAFDYYEARARQMMSVGINLNFGPVLDQNKNPLNPIIGALDRSYGKDPAKVVRLATAFVAAHRAAGVMSCGKHFPGHGSSLADTHLGPADINPSWSEEELLPFREMVALGNLDSVMLSHVVHRRFSDNGSLPVSLSRTAMDVLRSELGFLGPVVTDDLQMRAITEGFSQVEAAIAALRAGNTFLIYSNYRDEYTVETAALVQRGLREAVNSGLVQIETLTERNRVAREFLVRLR